MRNVTLALEAAGKAGLRKDNGFNPETKKPRKKCGSCGGR